MKRNVLLKAICTAVISMTAFSAMSQSVVVDGINYTISAEDPYNYAYVSSVEDRTLENASIQPEVEYNGETYPVRLIGRSAFNYCKSLTSVTLPSSISWIDGYSFMNSGIKSITIPENVEYIGNSAFASCNDLKDVTILGCNYIDNFAFGNDKSIESITLPANLDSISPIAFRGSNNLKEIKISQDNKLYTSIDGVLFTKDHSGLLIYPNGKGLEYDIPEGTDSIGKSAFYQSEIQYVTFPQSLKKIGDEAFYSCNGMDEITIDGGIEEVGNQAFSSCGQLETVIIGEQVKAIGSRAFDMCTKLTEINIPDGVTRLGSFAFDYNTALKKVTLGKGITIISNDLFSYDSALEEVIINGNIQYIDESAFMGCRSLKSFTIQETVDSIASSAFYGCYGMEEVFIGSNVKKIGKTTFLMCSGLKKIHCAATKVPDIENNTFSDYTATLYVSTGCKEKYAAHAIWGLFTDIQEETPSGIEHIGVDTRDDYYKVYTVSGTLVALDEKTSESLPTGIYIVRTANGVKKISK